MCWQFLRQKKTMKNSWKSVFILSLFVGGALSLFASSAPDGLEKVAESQGFIGNTMPNFFAFIPDYVMPGIDGWLSTSLAGVSGSLIVFLVISLFGKWIYRA